MNNSELITKILNMTPVDVLQIMDTITDTGFEAYLVGGCVRDILLELTPKDYDITTNAPITALQELFLDMKMHGQAFGVVVVQTLERTVEIAYYRKDIGTGNHRHPREIDFDYSIAEDVLRRDFTVNAIAVNRSGTIMATTSFEDIENKIIRLVGDPFKRLEEDALRIMRAYRFAATKGLQIHPETRNAIKVKRKLLKHISPERIGEEFFKILMGRGVDQILTQMTNDYIFDIILPEFVSCIGSEQHSKYHKYTIANHIIKIVSRIFSHNHDLEVRVAAFFHDIGKPLVYFMSDDNQPHHYGKKEYDQLNHEIESKGIAYRVLSGWGCSSKFIKDVCTLVECHIIFFWDNPSKRQIKKLLNVIGIQGFEWLVALQYADRCASGTRSYLEQDKTYIQIQWLLSDIIQEKEAFTRAGLALNGNDVHKLLRINGQAIGSCLQSLMDYVIANPNKNNKDDLITFLKGY